MTNTVNNPWRRAGQPTPVFLPGELHGQRSLAGYCLPDRMGHKQSDATEHALLITVRPTSRSGRIGEWGVGLNSKGQWAEHYPEVPECSLMHTASPAERLPPPLGGSGAGLHVHWWAPWYQLPEAEKGWPVDDHLLPVRSGTPHSVPLGKGSE